MTRHVRRKPHITDLKHDQPVALHLLGRQFTAAGTNQTWIADTAVVATRANWLSMAARLDVYFRRVVGWALGAHWARAVMSNWS